MGLVIAKGTEILRRLLPGKDGIAGTILVILVAGLTLALSTLVFVLAYQLNTGVGFVVHGIMGWQVLAARSLQRESMQVYERARQNDLAGARKVVSMMGGRGDPASLSMKQVIKATVETVAERISLGVIGPLFFLALGGPPLAMLYQAVNTMDSILGYKNSPYLDFGRAAVQLDAIVNWLPARLSARLMIGAAGILNLNAKNAVRVYKRDRNKPPPSNSGHTEAVAAGALGIALGGKAWYFGKLYEKPMRGDATRPVNIGDILSSTRLMYMSTMLFLPIACIISAILSVIIMVRI
jgi:adenosylcobinamide-phosphate synthase